MLVNPPARRRGARIRIYLLSPPILPLRIYNPFCNFRPKMLRVAMPGTSPKSLAALVLCVTPLLFVFLLVFHAPTPWGSSLTNKSPQPSRLRSSAALSIQDTKDLADQNDIFDTTLEGGARIRQACMLFSSDDTTKEMGANVVYERSVRTHLKHAERWGYPSHILREDIIGNGKWEVLVQSP